MSSTLRSAGEAAPAFQLPNQDGVPSDLADFRGHYLLLWWYPKADTPGERWRAKGSVIESRISPPATRSSSG